MPERERGIPEEALDWKAPSSEKKELPVATSEKLDNALLMAETAIEQNSSADFRKLKSQIDQFISTEELNDEELDRAVDLSRAFEALAQMSDLGYRRVIERLAKNDDQIFEHARAALVIYPKLRGALSADMSLTLSVMGSAVDEVSKSMKLEASKEKIAKTKVS